MMQGRSLSLSAAFGASRGGGSSAIEVTRREIGSAEDLVKLNRVLRFQPSHVRRGELPTYTPQPPSRPAP